MRSSVKRNKRTQKAKKGNGSKASRKSRGGRLAAADAVDRLLGVTVTRPVPVPRYTFPGAARSEWAERSPMV